MRRIKDKKVLKDCRIYQMLRRAKRHTSFHTPGHKIGKWDITELSFSDNLSCPTGVLKKAEKDIARMLNAYKSFILVDGSTCGILSMIKASGAKKILIPRDSHKSVYNAAALMGVELKVINNRSVGGISLPPTAEEIKENISGCGAVLLTYPDYYGNLAPLDRIKEICMSEGALLLVDGAHGAMLKGTKKHCGVYADMWVDGAHKSLPCLTQGAAVSCKEESLANALSAAVDTFRTTSPNYILMASVEYAFKYPRNLKIEGAAEKFKEETGAYKNGDWSKAVFHFGKRAAEVEGYLEKKGIYSEFCDGENIMFYFSHCTKVSELRLLKRAIKKFPLEPLPIEKTALKAAFGGESEYVPLNDSEGRICAVAVGLFPPCIPLVSDGEKITREHIEKLLSAANTFGLEGGKIKVYK